jgi:hypothetical protein
MTFCTYICSLCTAIIFAVTFEGASKVQAKHIPIVNYRLRASLLAVALLLILAVSLSTQGESDSSPTNLLIRNFRAFRGAPVISRHDIWIQNGRARALVLGMWAKGGAGAYYVMIFTQSGAFIPKTVAFSADPDLMQVRLPGSRLGTGGQHRTTIFMSLPGHFNLFIDRLQFQNKPGRKDKSECESEEL